MDKIKFTVKEVYDEFINETNLLIEKNPSLTPKSISRYLYESYRDRLYSLLLEESFMNNEHDEVTDFLYYSASLMFRKLTEEIVVKKIDKNIALINKELAGISVGSEDICYNGDIIDKYEATISILYNLHHQKINPLNLFENFITCFSISFKLGGKRAKFKARLSASYTQKKDMKWMYFDNLTEFFDNCRDYMLKVVCDDIKSSLTQGCFLLPSILPNSIYALTPDNFSTPKDFYMYIYCNKAILANVNLDCLYLLTHYEDTGFEEFSNAETMLKIVSRIEMNRTTKAYKKCGAMFYPYSIVDFSDI